MLELAKKMTNQVHVFFAAIAFFTRIPIPKWVKFTEKVQRQLSLYFPVIGWIVGGICAGSFLGFSQLLSKELSILLCMIVGIFLTGALHEDGFADICDGFGGGWTKEKILLIMKDSSVGAYGAIGLIFLFASKFLILREIPILLIAPTMLLSHSISRGIAITLLFSHEYARTDDSSKSRSVIKKFTVFELFLVLLLALIPFAFFQNLVFLLSIVPLLFAQFFLGRFFQNKIQGYTGDCLGASQQILEILFYLSFLTINKAGLL